MIDTYKHINSTSTNVRPTNVGRYEGRTVQTSDWYKRWTGKNVRLKQTWDGYKRTSDWYKRRTGTNVGLRQTSDKYKHRTETNVGLVQTSDFG